MDAINQGLQLSLYGITITFLALGILILVISLLQVIFPVKRHVQETAERPAEPEPEVETEDDHSRRVALAAAWWYWQKKRSSSLGKQLEQGPGKRWRKS
jgi:Na+-transporting methylmalonyl-CoA/oxaloacetate decarboxylase gamma subunit